MPDLTAWWRSGGRSALAAALLWLVAAPLHPCAPAPPAGAHVATVDEDALIVWDPGARREHFVRRARFITDAADFGFLVPTPSRPELAEAPAEVFARLEQAISPGLVERTDYDVCPSFFLCFVMLGRSYDARPRPAAAVRVLEETRVAGYDAVVLAADDARALDGWLRAHGYAQGGSLTDWLLPYVRDHWTITAFKVAGGSGAPVGTAVVRMSFATERPFFPYREPEDQRTRGGPARSLRVFVVAPERVEGALENGEPWPGRLEYAAPPDDLDRLLDGVVPGADVRPGAWLTAYRDDSTPRPGRADLFLAAARDTTAVRPPPVEWRHRTTLPLPLLELAVLGVVGGWWWRRRRRRRRATTAAGRV